MGRLNTTRLLRAFEFSARAHDQQKRMHPENTPYISHPYAVAMILSKAGYSEDVVIAGLLHDVIEDTTFLAHQIQEEFGDKVLSLVLDVTEDKELPYRERKQGYIDHLKVASEEACAISAADLLANRGNTLLALQEGREFWKVLNHKSADEMIAKDMERIGIIKSKVNNVLTEELEQVIEEIKELVYNAATSGSNN
jgi:guanosine-3',5'-bis(diphosphate) 3'-pyrophosphohydrolase